MVYQNRITVTAALFGVVFLSSFVFAQQGQRSNRPRHRSVKRVIVTLPPSNLNEDQKRALKDLRKMMDKLFGYNGIIPVDGKDAFERTVWNALNGARTPDRPRTDRIAAFLVDGLTKRKITQEHAFYMVEKTAELLSEPHETIAQEDMDAYEFRIRVTLASTQIPMVEQQNRLRELKELIALSKFGVAQ